MQLKYGLMVSGAVIFMLNPNGMPCLSAVIRVKTLDEEPLDARPAVVPGSTA